MKLGKEKLHIKTTNYLVNFAGNACKSPNYLGLINFAYFVSDPFFFSS